MKDDCLQLRRSSKTIRKWWERCWRWLHYQVESYSIDTSEKWGLDVQSILNFCRNCWWRWCHCQVLLYSMKMHNAGRLADRKQQHFCPSCVLSCVCMIMKCDAKTRGLLALKHGADFYQEDKAVEWFCCCSVGEGGQPRWQEGGGQVGWGGRR